MKIGEFIKTKRKEKNISLREMASKIDISHPYLSQIENNLRKASPEILDKISQIIDVSHYELMKIAGYIHEKEGLEKVVSDYCDLLNQIEHLCMEIRITEETYSTTKVVLQSLNKEREDLIKESAALKEEINSLNYQEGNTKEQIAILERQVEIYKQLENNEQQSSMYQLRLKNAETHELAFAEHKKNLSQLIKKQKLEIEKQLEISYTTAIEKIQNLD